MAEIIKNPRVLLTNEERDILRQAQNIFYELHQGDTDEGVYDEIADGQMLANFEDIGVVIEELLEKADTV